VQSWVAQAIDTVLLHREVRGRHPQTVAGLWAHQHSRDTGRGSSGCTAGGSAELWLSCSCRLFMQL